MHTNGGSGMDTRLVATERLKSSSISEAKGGPKPIEEKACLSRSESCNYDTLLELSVPCRNHSGNGWNVPLVGKIATLR